MDINLLGEIVGTLKYHLESKANTYVGRKLIIKRLKDNNTEISMQDINLAMQDFISGLDESEAGLCYSNNVFYFKDIQEAEDELRDYMETTSLKPSVSIDCSEAIKVVMNQIKKEKKIEFTVQQEKAVHNACNNRFSIITGGPGTGKTTIIEAIVSAWSKNAEVRIWAPTGKASMRIGEATGYYACTIHRGLMEEGMVGGLLIIDEASMIDTYLMGQILRYNRDNNIVLIGDADQIPSIGAGDVLFDLLHIKGVLVTRLDQGFRSDSTIIKNSKLLLKKTKLAELDYDESFLFINLKQKTIDAELTESDKRKLIKAKAEKIQQEVYKLWNYMLQQCQDIKGVIILVPLRKEDEETGKYVTVDTINRYIQKKRFHETGTKKIGSYYIKDRVIYNKNRYDIKPLNKNMDGELYNGMLGTVIAADKSSGMQVEFDNGAIFMLAASDGNITLAYALTVHKAQGSEFKRVLFVSDNTTYSDRNLFYTAITRAKEQVIMVG